MLVVQFIHEETKKMNKEILLCGVFAALMGSPLAFAQTIVDHENIARDGFLEIGFGPEFSGYGAQFHLPAKDRRFDFFGTAGFRPDLTGDSSLIGLGMGFNYFLIDDFSIGIHSSVAAIGDGDFFAVSINLKRHFDKEYEGLSYGISYAFTENDSYPFINIGYAW